MRKYIIMGAQGCGKGTQANMLAKGFNLAHISVGEIFRWHIQAHTKMAAHIQRYIVEGKLVPDEVVDEVIKARLDQHDWNFGFILDGFPRNQNQASFFLESYDIDAVILIDVPDQVVLERIMNRRLCGKCGLDYNLIFHRPEVPEVCDVCKGNLVVRADDNPEAVRSRLKDYHKKTGPVLELFKHKELIIKVDGTEDPNTVQSKIREKLSLSKKFYSSFVDFETAQEGCIPRGGRKENEKPKSREARLFTY